MKLYNYLEWHNNELLDSDYGCGCCSHSSYIKNTEEQKAAIEQHITELREIAIYWENELREKFHANS